MFDTTAPQWQEPNNQSLSDLISSYRPPPAIRFSAPAPVATTTRSSTISMAPSARWQSPPSSDPKLSRRWRRMPSHALCQLHPAGAERPLRARHRSGLARPQPRQIRPQAEDAGGAARAASSLDRRGHRNLPGARLLNGAPDLRAWDRQRAAPQATGQSSVGPTTTVRRSASRKAKPGSASGCPARKTLSGMLDATPRYGVTSYADADGRPFSYFKMARIMREERNASALLDSTSTH
jgi:hypothetical protein